MRTSVYGIVVNVVQSLCTTMATSEASLRSLTLLLSRASEPKFRIQFGIGHVATNAFILPDAMDDKSDKISLGSAAHIVSFLLDVSAAAAPSPHVAAQWTERLTSLVVSTAFRPNPPIQARALVALGCIAAHSARHDELLETKVLSLLGNVLSDFHVDDDMELVNAALMCLAQMVIRMPAYVQKKYFFLNFDYVSVAD